MLAQGNVQQEGRSIQVSMAATGGEPTRFPLVFLGLLAGTAAVGLRLGCTGATAGGSHGSPWKKREALTTGYFIIAGVSIFCAARPSLPTLIAARALGGLCWGLAAVHYPTWVNRYGPADKRTLWMAGINAMLLTGIVSGYVVGGLSRATGAASWEFLYLMEGLLMLGCGICGSRFASKVVQVGEPEPAKEAEEAPAAEVNAGQETSVVPKELRALGRSGLFLCTLAAGCFQSGSVGFMLLASMLRHKDVVKLYFITQALGAIFHWSAQTISIVVSIVITVGPIGGIILGANYLNGAGGYRNYRRANAMTAVCAILSFLSGCSSPVIYGAANLGLLLFGAAPTAAINGIAVSCVPEAKHFASATQFAAQNLAKLLIPLLGGAVIDRIGLVRGYHTVTIGALIFYALAACTAYLQAARQDDEDADEE
eukprot:s251_g9.t1